MCRPSQKDSRGLAEVKYFSQILQDVDGSPSSKRWAFLVFIILFCTLTLALLFHAVPKESVDLIKQGQDKTQDLIKWLGGFIASEQATKLGKKD